MKSACGVLLLGPWMTGCVVMSGEKSPPPLELAAPIVETARVEGLEFKITSVDAVVITNSFGSATGYGRGTFSAFGPAGSVHGSASSVGTAFGSASSTSTVIGTHTTDALRQLAVMHLENRRAVRVVNGKEEPQYVLRGAVREPESNGALWSGPLNFVTFFALVLPATWGENFGVTLRVYDADGQFLREYAADADARSFHHWAHWTRREAAEERKAHGYAVATVRVLDAFIADAEAGRIQAR